jgi:hypothetical protein
VSFAQTPTKRQRTKNGAREMKIEIEFDALKRIAKATPELTMAQFVAVWTEKLNEEKRHTERERIAGKRATKTNATPTTANNEQHEPTYAERESELYRFAEQVCGKRAGGFVKTLLTANRNDIAATRAIFERAKLTHDPRAFIATAAGNAKNGHPKNGAGNPTMEAFQRIIDRGTGGALAPGADGADNAAGGGEVRCLTDREVAARETAEPGSLFARDHKGS